jgi:hypothetical protein
MLLTGIHVVELIRRVIVSNASQESDGLLPFGFRLAQGHPFHVQIRIRLMAAYFAPWGVCWHDADASALREEWPGCAHQN